MPFSGLLDPRTRASDSVPLSVPAAVCYNNLDQIFIILTEFSFQAVF